MHLQNAQLPIYCREFGKRSSLRLEQLANARSPIFFTESGIIIVSIDSHPLNKSSFINSIYFGKDMFPKNLHPQNAPHPIDVTESGILILSNDLHPENA